MAIYSNLVKKIKRIDCRIGYKMATRLLGLKIPAGQSIWHPDQIQDINKVSI